MITGAHAILYSTDAEADRAFLRTLLGTRSVDAGDGWLILALPPAEIAVHPTDGAPAHELYLLCDDVDATVADLTARGVAFEGGTTDEGWGRRTSIRLPGGGALGLYQPRHPVAAEIPTTG
ncbi:extradiol dioxygenase [Pseudonocardia kujensis]|uniref:VOC family protein n=1 Tax=Pseudonocardia kujensis TaxID=1128675 RepID=UPI001E36025D|nr:VOC family protein [Pseudonocardia kujensis]MCE0761469.1 extradiol dioxygenase [Pseudonocardia kujensis]